MLTVFVCVGSSCYLRGSEKIAETFERLIEKEKLGNLVELRGSMCMEHCAMGVSIRVGDRVYHQISPEGAEAFFYNEIAPQASR
jgi:NADH:ubiquinone oxidoreductase subunit E